jgi:non-ribosomal peptide synthetase component F
VEILAPGRATTRSPLIEVKFVLLNTPYQDSPRAELEQLGNLKIEVENVIEPRAKFDLLLTLWEIDGQLKGNIEYRSELFERATVEMLRAGLQEILEIVTQQPEIAVDALQDMLDHSAEIAMQKVSSTKLDAIKRKEVPPSPISG